MARPLPVVLVALTTGLLAVEALLAAPPPAPVVVPPKLTRFVAPRFEPADVPRAGAEVLLELDLDVGGRVRASRVRAPSGVPGVRLDTWVGDLSAVALDPRLSVRHQVDPLTAWKLALGVRRQDPDTQLILPGYGTPGLRPFAAAELSAGAERRLGEHMILDLAAFYKRLAGVPIHDASSQDPTRFVNAGQGQVWGAELFVRYLASEHFFGWLAYTFQRAQRRDSSSDPWRIFDYDQAHILTAVASWRLGRGWEAGLRWRYTTGLPFTEMVGSKLDADRQTYTGIPGTCHNCSRIPAFHALDLRVGLGRGIGGVCDGLPGH